jgi:hypothetical protein
VVRESRKWQVAHDGTTHRRQGRSSNARIWMVCWDAGGGDGGQEGNRWERAVNERFLYESMLRVWFVYLK